MTPLVLFVADWIGSDLSAPDSVHMPKDDTWAKA